jgi:hypothetical protein
MSVCSVGAWSEQRALDAIRGALCFPTNCAPPKCSGADRFCFETMTLLESAAFHFQKGAIAPF